MREFKVLHSGEVYTVASLMPFENIPKLCGRALAFLPTASEKYDLEVIDIGTEKIDRKIAKELIEGYLTRKCGFPQSRLYIMLLGKAEQIEIFNTPGGIQAQKGLKCKQIYTNTVTMPDLVELTLTTLVYPVCTLRIYECRDIENCRKELLSRMLVIEGLVNADVSVFLSQGDFGISYLASKEGDIVEKAINDYLNLT